MSCKGEGNCSERKCGLLTGGETAGTDTGSGSTLAARQGVQREVFLESGGEWQIKSGTSPKNSKIYFPLVITWLHFHRGTLVE